MISLSNIKYFEAASKGLCSGFMWGVGFIAADIIRESRHEPAATQPLYLTPEQTAELYKTLARMKAQAPVKTIDYYA